MRVELQPSKKEHSSGWTDNDGEKEKKLPTTGRRCCNAAKPLRRRPPTIKINTHTTSFTHICGWSKNRRSRLIPHLQTRQIRQKNGNRTQIDNIESVFIQNSQKGSKKAKNPRKTLFLTVFRPPKSAPTAEQDAARYEGTSDPLRHSCQVSSNSAHSLAVKKSSESEKIHPKRVTSLVGRGPSIADISRNLRRRTMPFDRHGQKGSTNIDAKFRVFPLPSSQSSTLRKNKVPPQTNCTAQICCCCLVIGPLSNHSINQSLLENSSSVWTGIAMTMNVLTSGQACCCSSRTDKYVACKADDVGSNPGG